VSVVVLGLLAVKTPINKVKSKKKKKNMIAYSTNSEIAELAESLNKSYTRDGVYSNTLETQ